MNSSLIKSSHSTQIESADLYRRVAEVLRESRTQLARAINTAVVRTYWEVGRIIVEDEQKGEHRAEYGKQVLIELSNRLMQEFGEGFTVRGLTFMRQFYIAFPIWNAVRSKLSWSHYTDFTYLSTEEELRAEILQIQESTTELK